MKTAANLLDLENASEFLARHIGVDADDEAKMLKVLGVSSRVALMQDIVPHSIQRTSAMDLPDPITEAQALAELKAIASKTSNSKVSSAKGITAPIRLASFCATF